jgi:hypothetical protein
VLTLPPEVDSHLVIDIVFSLLQPIAQFSLPISELLLQPFVSLPFPAQFLHDLLVFNEQLFLTKLSGGLLRTESFDLPLQLKHPPFIATLSLIKFEYSLL